MKASRCQWSVASETCVESMTSVTSFDIAQVPAGITILLITYIPIQRGRDRLQASRSSCVRSTGDWQLATDN
jgi:hypothetical protein